jgi:DNA adenine methylase
MPRKFNRLIEPFAGMAAITIAAAKENRAGHYCINDINGPLVRLMQEAVESPASLIEKYTAVWEEQFIYPHGHLEHFFHVRNCFNKGVQTAENMLYLLARCVKGSVRYGKNGNFNQSPDKRRHGTTPKNIKENVCAVSALLKGKISFSSVDYRQILEQAQPGDIVYMDPPYQGVSNSSDNRYYSGVVFGGFADSIEILNRKGVSFIISYDGECGEKEYGKELPRSLNYKKILLNAGRSTQATLMGKREDTFESLYVSNNLARGGPGAGGYFGPSKNAVLFRPEFLAL